MCGDLKVGPIIADLRCFIICCDLQNAPKVLIFVPLMLILDSRVVYSIGLPNISPSVLITENERAHCCYTP